LQTLQKVVSLIKKTSYFIPIKSALKASQFPGHQHGRRKMKILNTIQSKRERYRFTCGNDRAINDPAMSVKLCIIIIIIIKKIIIIIQTVHNKFKLQARSALVEV